MDAGDILIGLVRGLVLAPFYYLIAKLGEAHERRKESERTL